MLTMSHCPITHSTRFAQHGIIKSNPNPTTNPHLKPNRKKY